jgi:hypothetical protein
MTSRTGFAAALSSFEEMLRIPSNSGCAGTEESEGRSAILVSFDHSSNIYFYIGDRTNSYGLLLTLNSLTATLGERCYQLLPEAPQFLRFQRSWNSKHMRSMVSKEESAAPRQ